MQPFPTRRVVITGAGLISPLGVTRESLWDALANGRSGVGPLEMLPVEHLPTSFAAEAHEFTGHIDNFGPLEKTRKKALRKGLKLMCRETQMAVAAAQLAMNDAEISGETVNPERTGVIFGTDHMTTLPDEFVDGVKRCMDEDSQFQFSQWGEIGLSKVEPLWLLKYLPNMPACCIAIYNDLRGPNNSITVREAAANLAIGEAFHIISRGDADTLIAGATGTRVHPIRTVQIALHEQVAIDGEDPTKLSRPFDADRTGMVFGEGAAAIIVESLENAQQRGANIMGEIVGRGASSVMSRECVAHCDQALENAMRQALTEAGMTPDEVGHIHAHALSTRQGDIDEARAINRVFGDCSTPVPVTAAKSYFGNLGAGAGAIEVIASLLSFEHGRLFPMLNYETPDPDCPIAAVTADDAVPGSSFLSISYTPQGQASAILIRAFEP